MTLYYRLSYWLTIGAIVVGMAAAFAGIVATIYVTAPLLLDVANGR